MVPTTKLSHPVLPALPALPSLTVDHLTYTLNPLPDEFNPRKRLWEFFKMGVLTEANYDHALQETLYTYYQAKGCVYKSHHNTKKV